MALNNIRWIYVLAIVVLALVSVLRFFDKISEANCVQIFLLIIGACITGAVAFVAGRYYGYKEGRVSA